MCDHVTLINVQLCFDCSVPLGRLLPASAWYGSKWLADGFSFTGIYLVLHKPWSAQMSSLQLATLSALVVGNMNQPSLISLKLFMGTTAAF